VHLDSAEYGDFSACREGEGVMIIFQKYNALCYSLCRCFKVSIPVKNFLHKLCLSAAFGQRLIFLLLYHIIKIFTSRMFKFFKVTSYGGVPTHGNQFSKRDLGEQSRKAHAGATFGGGLGEQSRKAHSSTAFGAVWRGEAGKLTAVQLSGWSGGTKPESTQQYSFWGGLGEQNRKAHSSTAFGEIWRSKAGKPHQNSFRGGLEEQSLKVTTVQLSGRFGGTKPESHDGATFGAVWGAKPESTQQYSFRGDLEKRSRKATPEQLSGRSGEAKPESHTSTTFGAVWRGEAGKPHQNSFRGGLEGRSRKATPEQLSGWFGGAKPLHQRRRRTPLPKPSKFPAHSAPERAVVASYADKIDFRGIIYDALAN
jgi:hypothetical protein